MNYHRPVLLREVLAHLNAQSGKWYLDATLGDGGHSLEILKQGGNIVGIDQDPKALERVEKRFKEEEFGQDRFKLVYGNFRSLDKLTKQEGKIKFSGVVFDLGVSSLQLEDKERGFSFRKDALLDMRMDPNFTVRAVDLINGLNKGELEILLKKYGEEAKAKKIAQEIVSEREKKWKLGLKLDSTLELANLIRKIVKEKKGIHPATKTFQALRIAVNDEINAIDEALEKAIDLVEKDGFVLAISFHSLEDRVVKTIFKKWDSSGLGQIITDKPTVPTEAEIRMNPRSRSAKLRVFKKINETT